MNNCFEKVCPENSNDLPVAESELVESQRFRRHIQLTENN